MSIKPKLGLWDLSMIIFSLVVGIGIFRTPSEVAQQAGSPLVYFLAWSLGGIISLFGALTFAEIGARYPVAGGLYQIFSHAYHPALALMINWVLLLTMGASFALVALVGAEYIAPLILPVPWQGDLANQLLAIGIIMGLTLINWQGIRTGARTQSLLSGAKIVLMLVICLGVFWVNQAPVSSIEGAPEETGSFLSALGVSLIAVFFTYGGYQQTMNFGADAKNPQRTLPRAIGLGVGLILLLYLLLNFTYFYVLGLEGIAQSDLVAAEVSKTAWGPAAEAFVSITIFLSVLGFLNATLLSTPRMYYAMAVDKVLPPIFQKLNERTQVQEFSLLFYVGISLVSLLALQTFKNILNYVMFIDSLAMALAGAALFVLRAKDKTRSYRGFRVPLYPIVPATFVAFLAFISLNVMITETKLALVGLALLLGGYPLYFLMRRGQKA